MVCVMSQQTVLFRFLYLFFFCHNPFPTWAHTRYILTYIHNVGAIIMRRNVFFFCIAKTDTGWCHAAAFALELHCTARERVWNSSFVCVYIVSETNRRSGAWCHFWLKQFFASVYCTKPTLSNRIARCIKEDLNPANRQTFSVTLNGMNVQIVMSWVVQANTSILPALFYFFSFPRSQQLSKMFLKSSTYAIIIYRMGPPLHWNVIMRPFACCDISEWNRFEIVYLRCVRAARGKEING